MVSGMYPVKIIHILQWRHNERDGISNHQPHDCLLNRLLRRKSKKTSHLRVTGLCEGNSPVTGEFPTQKSVTRIMFPLMTSSGNSLHCFACSYAKSWWNEFLYYFKWSVFLHRHCANLFFLILKTPLPYTHCDLIIIVPADVLAPSGAK